ncbi:hypothetical protein LTR86_009524 [Recurvomyces mirabilis]|nr:hypothetical protein LTR86_009524 [Recurvomyces mirabilis]
MQFINQTGTQEDDPETRQTIRRHVMLGRNRGRRPPKPKQPSIPGAAVLDLHDATLVRHASDRAIPSRVGSDISFLEFADDVEQTLMAETLHFCSFTNEHMYVLEPCISFEDYDPLASCFQPLASDPLYLNAMVFSSKIFRDIASQHSIARSRGGKSNRTLEHYGKAIRILRERVAENESPDSGISDITIMAVLLLAMHALVVGHATNARTHVEGMARMIHMREGKLSSFKDKTKQLMEIFRCDLCISLATGQPPLLSPQGLFNNDDLSGPTEASSGGILRQPNPNISDDLSKIWAMMKHFCATINKATITERKVSDRTFLHTMSSVMYGALRTSPPAGSSGELIRLAILSLSADAFLQWRRVRVPLPWLQRRYKEALARRARKDANAIDPTLALWLLLIYAVSYNPVSSRELSELQGWLIGTLRQCKLSSWADVKRAMESYLWIDLVCDSPAQALIGHALEALGAGV